MMTCLFSSWIMRNIVRSGRDASVTQLAHRRKGRQCNRLEISASVLNEWMLRERVKRKNQRSVASGLHDNGQVYLPPASTATTQTLALDISSCEMSLDCRKAHLRRKREWRNKSKKFSYVARPVATADIRGQWPQNFVVSRKIYFNHMIKTKLFPPKMYFAPQTPKPGYGPL